MAAAKQCFDSLQQQLASGADHGQQKQPFRHVEYRQQLHFETWEPSIQQLAAAKTLFEHCCLTQITLNADQQFTEEWWAVALKQVNHSVVSAAAASAGCSVVVSAGLSSLEPVSST